MSAEILRVGIVTPVQRIDPYGTIDYIGGVVSGQLFQPPFGFVNAGSDIRPVVFATDLRKENDTRWSGQVRADIRFSDGSPIGPADVVASLNRAWAADRGVTVHEQAGRVVIEFPEPVSDPHAMLVPTWCAITKDGEGKIGSGAYVMAEDSTDTRIRLLRNPHYGGEQGKASIREVHLNCYEPDESGSCAPLLEAIERGDIDFTQVLGRDDAAGLTRVRKLYQPGSSTALLCINCERVPELELRRGIIESIDRYALTSLCYSNPAGFVARGLLPPRMGSFGDGVAQRPVDPKLFEGRPPFRLAVIWGPRPYLSKPTAVAESIREQLGRVGLEVVIEMAPDPESYFRILDEGDYDAVLTGWLADSGDPSDFVGSLVSSEYIPSPESKNPAAANLSRWRSPEADAMMAKIRLGDVELMGKLIRWVGEQAPMLPLMYGPSVTVLSRRVRSFEPHPLNIYPLFAELELES